MATKWQELNVSWTVTEEQYTSMNTKSTATFSCIVHPNEPSWTTQVGVMRRGTNRCKQCRKALPHKL